MKTKSQAAMFSILIFFPLLLLLPCSALAQDTDGDGLSDDDETNIYLTNPLDWDTDGDGLPDGYEADHLVSSPLLDPLISSDGALDYDGDSNPNVHEYWNQTDPWTPDPVGGPGCFYWGDAGPGDGFLTPYDQQKLFKTILGGSGDYAGVIPPTGYTQDLDADLFLMSPDLLWLRNMILDMYVSGPPSRAKELLIIESPGASVAVGSTCHVTLGVLSEHVALDRYSPGLGVVFWIDPVSTGTATIFGGDGEDSGGRYDISGPSTHSASSRMVFRIDSVGTILVNAKIPACGQYPMGRYCPEITLAAPVEIVAEP